VHKAYYSHDLRMRKPDVEIYQYVLDENNLIAEETIFLDDNADNIKGAEKIGIRVKYIAEANQVFDLFD
jgi:putative hydrolase of the HAD superfamily